MTIGAFIDLGVDFHDLDTELRKLGLLGYELHQSKVLRSGIAATKFDVITTLTSEGAHQHTHPKKHTHTQEEHSHRSLTEIVGLIERSSLARKAKDLARKIFERLGAAEAKVHNILVERVHFHEVGAVDSIVDIVGSAICLDWLNFDKIVCSPINVGAGFVNCAHGKLPVPGPATAELLKSIPIFSAGPEVELTTPTGAAIVSSVASEFRRLEHFQSNAIGYGAGFHEFNDFPNALRLFVGEEFSGESAFTSSGNETVSIIEANIDDMNPQIYGYFLEKALAAGALDAFVTPVQMKKSRPGQWLTVICRPEKVDALTQLVFSETTTIGLRIHEAKRRVLERSSDSIDTAFGTVRIKISRLNGNVLTISPEYDDCQRLAQEKAVPLKDVLAEANAKIRILKF